jgi:large subunit ribosomal protein L30
MAVKKTRADEKDVVERELRIKLVRSLIGYPRTQREVAKGLGLRKINSEVIRPDLPEIRGMVNKIIHLLKVEVVEKK